MDFSGILLAGGKSRRFGLNKIKLSYEGVPLAAVQIVKLGFFAGQVIISTSLKNKDYIDQILEDINSYTSKLDTPDSFKLPIVSAVTDDSITGEGHKSIGPIAGIYTGLKASKHEYSVVLASDMPFISFRLLKLLTDKAGLNPRSDAVIIRNNKGVEALCGIYSKKCIKIIEDGIIKGVYKISDILQDMEVCWIGPGELDEEEIDIYNFFNINSRRDVEEFIKILNKGVSHHGANNIHSRTGQKWKDNFFRGPGQGTYQEKI